MNVTRDVIIDLLPLYFSGEVSADTKALVQDFLRADPEFARMAQRFDTLVERLKDSRRAGGDVERRALQETRRLLRYRNQTIGLAVAYSLAPFLFFFRNGRIEWVLFQDKPKVAIGFAIAAVGCWIAVWLLGRRRVLASRE